MWGYVYQKIESAANANDRTATGIPAWFYEIPELLESMTEAQKREANPALELVRHIRFDVFSVKQDIMMGFLHKVGALKHAVQQMASATAIDQVDPKT